MQNLAIRSVGLVTMAAAFGLLPAPGLSAHDAALHDHGAAVIASRPDAVSFLAETGTAMDRMMAAMMLTPTGDIDADFAAMMIPHHQGAIDMALAELRYGKNEQLRRIAQEIIVDQQQEIAAMRLGLGQTPPAPAPAPTVPPKTVAVSNPN